MALTFQIGDLVRFAPHPAPILGLPEIGLVIECRELTHESRGYRYEVAHVQFGDTVYILPSSDFELVKRV